MLITHTTHTHRLSELNSYIASVGFHNNKTKFIKSACKELLEENDGKVPNTVEGLCALSGVGPKMAYIVLSVAFGIVDGIGIDTHMHRMFNKLGWVKSKNPEETRLQLESWLPREDWKDVNLIWVGFGQESQQQAPKTLRKVLACSQPREALRLVKRLGMDVHKVAKKEGDELVFELKDVMTRKEGGDGDEDEDEDEDSDGDED